MAESKDSPKSVRKVKNPETFRERAIKASEKVDQPTKRGRIRSAAGRPVKPVVRAARKVGSTKPARIIGWPFRFLGRILVPKYVRNSYQELKLVEWPDRKKTRQLTTAVLIFAVVFAAVVSAVDFVLEKLFREVLLK